ncbi:permease prefix domain 1-containing protein [Nonomuraea zeae]|uniref:Uncharacterized protein n=1 Tax=Nonomuraea zeae TaxID=1642303 RepID=A0A5S4GIX5_9ACTN|nr:permease prefix domain 1-containing protein [Nonomuraea zeae]TMR32916.1 hypothetical protein ETD85_21515 [Nonomuraea zeae]
MLSSTVERYLEVAVAGVAPGEREDAGRELRDAIEEGVSERIEAGLDEAAAVEAVLAEFGDPLQFAARYRGRPLGLISSVRYPAWRTLVRLLLAIVVPICAGAAFAVEVAHGASVAEILGGAALAAVEAVVHVMFWTTLAFVLVDRWWPAPAEPEVPWSTAYLPVSSGRTRPGRVETLLWAGSAVAGIAFAFAQRVVSPCSAESAAVPLLAPAGWAFWWPFVIVALALQAGAAIAVGRRGWTAALRVSAFALDLAIALPLLWLLVSGQALNPVFLDALDWGGWSMPVSPGDVLVAALFMTVAAGTAWRAACVRPIRRFRGAAPAPARKDRD